MRVLPLCCLVFAVAQTAFAQAQPEAARPLQVLDVPFVSQSELLCGGAAAAMVLRYWGERELAAESFAHLVDRSAAGIRPDALVADLRGRGWTTRSGEGDEPEVRTELAAGRPVLLLVEDRPSTFHYVVVVAWHERGVVFHDPARGPFRVASTRELARRWRAARRWMAVIEPRTGARDTGSLGSEPALEPTKAVSTCDRATADAVRLTQVQKLDDAERVLAEALDCPGVLGELAGLRVLQKRWSEAADLASAAAAADRGDAYAWQVLATSRFVQDDRLAALDAWNAIGEPRIDLVRIDGLTRTRHPVVERFLDARPGELLTAGRFTRAERRLAEFPAAMSARLDYVPVSSGLAELRAAVAERPLVPRGRATIATAALAAAATREVRLSSGALTGGGEELSFGYRFWRHRQRVDGELQAPAPWGGLWRIDAFLERQPFAGATRALAERAGVRVGLSDWANGYLRWSLAAGIDEWTSESRGALAGGVRWASLDDTLDAAAHVQAWPGRTGFATVGVTTRARSSVDGGRVRTLHPRAFVVIGTVTAQFVTVRTPLDLWPAGDTGHARPTLARAHPLLDDGALVVDRLGRTLLHATAEGRRWWRVRGPIRAAVAAFADTARTGRRWTGAPLTDLDAGIGARLALDGMPGLFRIDLAKGLRDGATVISVGYEPWDLVLE